MTNQETTLQFYGADESAPPGTLGHALAAFDRLLAADLEYDAAVTRVPHHSDLSYAELIAHTSGIRAAMDRRQEAIRACKELRLG